MKLFRTFSIYTIVGFLNAGIGFLLLPVLTHYLSPLDYGVISLVNTYVLILMPIMGLSTSSFISVEYYNNKIEPNQFKILFSSVRLIPTLVILPLTLLFLLCNNWLPSLMELPKLAYWLLLPLTLFVLYQENFRSFLIISKRAKLYSLTTLGKIAIEIPLTILFVVYAGFHWDGRIDAWLAAVIFFSFLSFYFYKKWSLLSLDISKTYIKQSIAFGLPLILHEIGKFVINQSDRLFLAKMVSVEEMGVYSVGYQVGMVILIVNTAFANFFSPFFFERMHRGNEKDKLEIVKVSYIFLASIFALLILLSISTPYFFAHFVGPKFAKGAAYVFWVGLGYCFWGAYLVFTNYIFFQKRNKILAYLAILNVVLNALCNYYFIQWFGAIGAAYATCLSFFVVAMIVAFLASKLHPMPWLEFRKLIKPFH